LGTNDVVNEEQHSSEHLLCTMPMLGNFCPSPLTLTILKHGIATSTSHFTKEETEAQGSKSPAPGHLAGSSRTGIGTGKSDCQPGCLHQSQTLSARGKEPKCSYHSPVSLSCTMSPSMCPSYTMSHSLRHWGQVHYRISSLGGLLSQEVTAKVTTGRNLKVWNRPFLYTWRN
jgi:hypothetical protein